MKKARILIILLIACAFTAGMLAFKARSYSVVPFYCTTMYGAPGTLEIYPTIAPTTTAYCTTLYNYTCYKSMIVSFEFK